MNHHLVSCPSKPSEWAWFLVFFRRLWSCCFLDVSWVLSRLLILFISNRVWTVFSSASFIWRVRFFSNLRPIQLVEWIISTSFSIVNRPFFLFLTWTFYLPDLFARWSSFWFCPRLFVFSFSLYFRLPWRLTFHWPWFLAMCQTKFWYLGLSQPK